MSGIESALFDLITSWYVTTGYLGIVLAMALESCCIPLPSEIVMPLAGFFVYCSERTALAPTASCPPKVQFTLLGVTLAGALGCVIGSTVAYAIGASGGRPLLLKYGKYILISRADSERADRWFARYGAPVAFFSRLLPVIRTYISLPAGVYRMNFGQFILFTFLGSLPWTFALAFVGMQLGSKITELGTIFHGLDAVILVVLVAAAAYYVYHHIKKDREAGSRQPDALTGQQTRR